MINGIRFDDQSAGNIYNEQRNPVQQADSGTVTKLSGNEQALQNVQTPNENGEAVYQGLEFAIRTALEEAGLALNTKNQGIVRQMLDNQMSIDRDSLNRIISQSNIFREADLSTILLMNKNNIPVTHFTAAQLQAYINNEQNLSEQIGNSIEGLMNFISEEADTGVFTSNIEVLQVITSGTEAASENMAALGNAENAVNVTNTEILANTGQNVNPVAGDTASPQNVISTVLSGQGGGEAVYALNAGQAAAVTDEASVLNTLQTSTVSNVIDGLGTDAEGSGANWMNGFGSDNDGLSEFDEYSTGKGSTGLSEKSLPEEGSKQKGTPLLEILNENEIKELNSLSRELFGQEKVFDKNEPTQEILKEILNEVQNAENPELKELFTSPVYQKLIKGALNDKFTLKESDIDSGEAVNRFYKETFSALSKLSEIVEKDGALAEKISKPMDNIKFMDTLNNVFPYIQLPLKLNEGKTHGELYVFKKGRSKVSENDTQSVLLHLDMDNLGATDIHMELKTGFLKLRFYCSDEISKDLLSGYISELEGALQNKGFSVGSEFSVRTADTAAMVEALSGSSENVPEFKYNFDIRA